MNAAPEPTDAIPAPAVPGTAPASDPAGTAGTAGTAHPATVVIAVVVGLWAISAARTFLVPLVIALLMLAIVNALERAWSHVQVGGRRLPRSVTTALSAALIVSIGVFLVELLVDNISGVIAAAPNYKARLVELSSDWREVLKLGDVDVLERSVTAFEPSALLADLAAAVAGLVGTTSLVIVYLVFLVLERGHFTAKLLAAFPLAHRRDRVGELLRSIDHDVSVYLGLKALVSLLTALLSYIVLRLVGLDFAEFWAVLIFAFNFIPNVGSLIATVLPALVALLQFDTLRPFVIVGVGVTAIQLLIANLVEPGLMGRRLNMSPLVVMLALVGWSLLWGLPGAFLSVPMTAVLLLVLARVPSTRWIAIMLSQDGRLQPLRDEGSSPLAGDPGRDGGGPQGAAASGPPTNASDV